MAMGRAVFLVPVVAVLLWAAPLAGPRAEAVQPSLQATPGVQGCDEAPADNYTQSITGLVDGDPLVLTVSARFGGAVDSLTWRGKEFVNTWDHGREIGYAWGMDGYGECLNPTEPGSANDYQAPASTTELLRVCRLADNSLSTTAQVAYWLAPGQSGGCAGGATTAVNDVVLSDHILEKTIEIGYQGIDNVIVFDAVITLPRVYRSNGLEIPTGYLTYVFNHYYLYNPQTGELIEPKSQPPTDAWSFELEGHLPPILATEDGAYAMGAYSAEPVRYYSILATDNPNPDDRTNKWNIVAHEEPALALAYSYRSFVIVGTLEEVQAGMRELYALHPADFAPTEGWIDVASCQEVAGWAWDPKTPNKPIEVEIYDLHDDGTETLLTQMIADQFRQDLVTALGDDGRHGFHVQTSSVVHDDQRHMLRVYAVNSDPGLPNRYLYGATSAIQCPGLRPSPQPTPTNTPVARPTSTTGPEATPSRPSTPTTGPETSPTMTSGPGGLACPSAALPLVFGAALWRQRRRQEQESQRARSGAAYRAGRTSL
jgi:hypothetical protein